MLKQLTLICILFALVSGLRIPRRSKSSNMRLIEFNETYREWMPFEKVLQLAEECGKQDQNGHISGFMVKN